MKSALNNLYKYLARKFITPRNSFVFGIAVTIGSIYFLVPTVQAQYTELAERLNPPIIAENVQAEAVEVTQQKEQLEIYYQEELEVLSPKYDAALEAAARTSAIERLEADLEVEKEKLRGTELFL